MLPQQNLQLLGAFGVTTDNGPVTGPIPLRAQSLLAYLILHTGPQSRQRLAFLLWPESSERQARTNLRKVLHQIRNTLPEADKCLLSTRAHLQWNPQAPYCIDVLELDAALTRAEDMVEADVSVLRQAAELYTGDLLPECYDEWIEPVRAEYDRRVQCVLAMLVRRLEDDRAYGEAIQVAQRLHAMDPLDEATVRRLMRLHLADGNRAAAVEVYQRLADVLERELGVEPDAETATLYERALSDDRPVETSSAGEGDGDAESLVGRTQAWRTLGEAWQRALHGEAHLIAIGGEAGIGKSRLAEELRSWAQRQGYRTARTRFYAAHGGLAYAPVAELLRSKTLAGDLGELEDVWLTQISRLLPELLVERPHLPQPQPMTEAWQRQRLFDATLRALAAEEAPLLLLIDDLQWGDRETLEWLTYILQQAPQARLLVVATVRTDEVDARHPYRELALALTRDDQLVELPLGPLDAADTEALGIQVAGHELSPDQAAQLFADTEGNPLFVVETMRAEFAQGDGDSGVSDAGGDRRDSSYARSALAVPGSDTAIARLPAKVHAVIRGRLGRLSSRAQELSSLAAVVGRSFSYEVLQAATSQDAATLTDGMEELLHARIIVDRGEDAYDFSHDRIRDVAYAEISSVRRRLLHDQVAQTLLQVHDGDADSISGQLAEHFVQAGRKAEAVDYLVRAGDHSAAQYANEEALDFYARALALLPEDAWAKQYEIMIRRLDVYARTQDVQRREAELDVLERVIAEYGDEDGDVRRRADLAIRRAQYANQRGAMEEALEYGYAAMRLAQESRDPYTEVLAGSEIGGAFWGLGEMHKAQATYAKSLELANEHGYEDRGALLTAMVAASGMFSGMPAQEIGNYVRQSLISFERTGNLVGQAECQNKLGYLHVHAVEGEYDTALYHYQKAKELAESSGSVKWQSTVGSNLGYLYILLGQYDQARLCHEHAIDLGREFNLNHRAGPMRVYLGYLERNRGDFASALATQQEAAEILMNVRFPLWGTWAHRELSLTYRAVGDLGRAETHARSAIDMARTLGDTRQEGYALTALGLAMEDQGCAEAADCFREAIDCYRRMELYNRSMAPLAGLARLAAKAGDGEQASAHLTQMLDHLAAHDLDKTEEGYRVYVTCYQLLCEAGDSRAADFLAVAQENLRVRAASLSEVEHLRLFWDMAGHRAIRDADASGAKARPARNAA